MYRSFGRFAAACFALCALVGGTAIPLRADDVVTTKKVSFKRGASSATLTGSVKGYDSVRYEISAKKGQKLSVKLTSKSRFLYFNVLNKRTDIALETEPAPREVTNWSGKLPEDGIYVVQVYLVRAEARRKGKANFSLSVALGGGSSSSSSASGTGRFAGIDQESGGSGVYTVNDEMGKRDVRKVHVVLKRDGSARIGVSLSEDGFFIQGTWKRESDKTVQVTITRGFDNSPLTGSATITLRNARQWEAVNFRFTWPKQKTRHTLSFQVA